MLGPENLSVNKVYAVKFVFVLQKIPAGNKIPSSGKLKLITSPLGTSAKNNVAPACDVVVNSKTPAPAPSDAIIIPFNLMGCAMIAAAPAAAADLVACISLLIAINLLCSWLPKEPLINYYCVSKGVANCPVELSNPSTK